ncbi:MAG: hypothetical protein M1814_003320 [Vezdaea aestivalis]|nr:MAG: hypothetical protein M1814_003320 [Vezdaea aestivalis]
MPSSPSRLNDSTVLKLDLLLLPYVSLLFLLNALDRSNIGNAETASFTRDAGLKPEDLNTAVSCFFVFFVALQPLGAAIGRRVGMATFVPIVMMLWGGLTVLHLVVRQKWQLITIRILIGCMEAGFYPTTVSYLSLFYTRFEFARRLGFFYGQYALASALGGVLSYVILLHFPPTGGLAPVKDPAAVSTETERWKPWQVLFLLEGGLTMLVALTGFWWLPGSADTAWFLNSDQKKWARIRIIIDRQMTDIFESIDEQGSDKGSDSEAEQAGRRSSDSLGNQDCAEAERLLADNSSIRNSAVRSQHETNESMTNEKGLTRQDILDAILEWKVWFLLICNICSSIPVVGFTIFLPMVIRGLNFSSAKANLMTAPPFIAGFTVLWIFMWLSDKKQERISFSICGLLITTFGLFVIIVLPDTAFSGKYLALCLMISGSFVSSPLTIAWLSGNMEEPGKRSVVLGINGWGNAAGIVSAPLFDSRYGPSYRIPFLVTLIFVALALAGFSLFRWLLLRENRQRRKLVESWTVDEVEKEHRWGLGPGSARLSWKARMRRLIDPEASLEGRRGDQRLTFLYGL